MAWFEGTRFLGGALRFASCVIIIACLDDAYSQARMVEAPSVDRIPFEDEGNLDDLDRDLRKIDKAFESDKPVSVSFPVLLKRTDTFLLSEVCYRGVVMTVRDSLAGSTLLVNVRTIEGLRPENVALLESLESTPLLPGHEVSFCGTVMGRAFVLVQPSAGYDAVQFDVTKLIRVRRSGGKAKSPSVPTTLDQSQCPAIP